MDNLSVCKTVARYELRVAGYVRCDRSVRCVKFLIFSVFSPAVAGQVVSL